MALRTEDPRAAAVEAPEVEVKLRANRLFTVVALFALIVGSLSMLGGIGGAIYTYQQAAVENITTPDDAVFPGVQVRGPMSMWAQSEIITRHQLNRTEGMRYAEMDRMVPMVDEAGAPVLDEAGAPVMVANQARASWLDATALTTVLGMGILAYAFSAFAFVTGLVLVGVGLIIMRLRRGLVMVE